ncbi:MAG: hypothetical protein P4L64_02425 [Caulobacteraceae bacterium]|nr:hypothetical protein [Caulobacteraceae bacterium]
MAAVGSDRSHSLFAGLVASAPKPASPPRAPLGIPREIIAMVGTALGIFLAVGAGSLIAAQVPDQSPWLFMLSFAAPAAVVFAIFWLISRRL